MSDLALTATVSGQMEDVCARVTESIKPAGFGILTQIDFDKKIKEKTGEIIKPCTILGACNPKLAHQAYLKSSDVALLIPCNIVLTEIEPGKIKIEMMRPTQMLKFLPGMETLSLIEESERALQKVLSHLNS